MGTVMSGPQRITGLDRSWPLHDGAGSRQVEALAAARCPPHGLMQSAGLGVARLALALAPHASRIWIAAGPGNNGGDGFEAAMHLQRAGLCVAVTAVGTPASRPADAAASLARAQDAGVAIQAGLPADVQADLTIDALLGLGVTRGPEGALAEAARRINAHAGVRLAVDLPTGLDADHGTALGECAVQATHTLSLLTVKPGLFTAQGRDLAGQVWFDDLGMGPTAAQVALRAWLACGDMAARVCAKRRHAHHKGSFGDVIVIGGARGMTGAVLLAGRAAIAAGAGRVYVSPLDPAASGHDDARPELMLRPGLWREAPALLSEATVVCGCGGGETVREALPLVLTRAKRLVLDADALNAIAVDASLQALLTARQARGLATVLTPHPREAARLVASGDAAAVQADRLTTAEQLAARLGCTVLLKGSGSVVATPQQTTSINASGNPRLASAGTGDVLAGWLGGLWSASQALGAPPDAHAVAQVAAWQHGAAADATSAQGAMTATCLLRQLSRAN